MLEEHPVGVQHTTVFSQGAKAFTVYACAAIGGFIAALADIVQKEEASAVSKLTSLSARHLQVTLEPYWILASLIVLATALCFVFQPNDRKQSFIVGMGIIAVIMTVTPYKQPLTGIPSAPIAKTSYNGPSHVADVLVASSSGTASWPLHNIGNDLAGRLKFMVKARNRSKVNATVGLSVYDSKTEKEFYQKAFLEPGQATTFVFDLGEQRSEPFRYAVEIQGRRLPPQMIASAPDLLNVEAAIEINPDQIISSNPSGDISYPTEIFLPAVSARKTDIFGRENSIFRKLNGKLGW
ncbi:hypothetical protein [Rhizobium laguerreae]|uniref:hypothetical protein n=1 Tax=Rhizobium laguerreae TaxID=1076926 RepID=UPI003008FFC5